MLEGFTRKFKPLEVLTEEQVSAIHVGALDVLETTGLRVEHDRSLALLADHGCKVDLRQKRVRIPGPLVEDCMRKCPSTFTIRARDPKYDLRIGGNTLYFSQNVGMRYVDLDTWETRPGTLQEHADAVKVLDALDTVHMLCAYEFYMDMENVSPYMMPIEGLASGIRNSVKAQCMGYPHDSEVFAIKMAKAVGMELRGAINTAPPLTIYEDCGNAAFRFVEAGFPLFVGGAPLFGGTGPATIAGSVVINLAETMALLVLVQLIKSGTGVFTGGLPLPMDMRSGHAAFGAVSSALHQVMWHQIWRRYQIPSCSMHTGYSGSKKIDFQAGYERAMNALVSALAGDNICFFHGAIHGELTYHPVMSILDDDVAGWIGRFIEGVDVTPETLAVDLIEQVGPIPGQYLNTEHTRKWWRREQFIPKTADREPYSEWIRKGKKDAIALAKKRMEEILSTHKSKPVTTEQDKAIGEVLEEARSYYRQKGLI